MADLTRSVARFPKTRWSLVARAKDGEQSKRALDEICREYWPPLYAYLRRSGHSVADAEDLTQEFLTRFVVRKNWAVADQAKGRLRSFLLTDLKLFLSDKRKHDNAQKRGGGKTMVEINGETMESELADDGATPDEAFERTWVLTLLKNVFDSVQETPKTEGERRLFQDMKEAMWAGSGKSQADIAREHGVSEVNVRVMAHRLRKRYRIALEATVRETLIDGDKSEEEIQYLFRVLDRV